MKTYEETIERAERICSECGNIMFEGYCIESGLEYYCSDNCLYKHYTEQEWEDLYEDGGDSYWTNWKNWTRKE